jgi:hypothetical protein
MEGRADGSVTISLCNFVGEGIIIRKPHVIGQKHSRINILQWILTKRGTYLVLRRVWNPTDCQGHRVKFLPCNIHVNTKKKVSTGKLYHLWLYKVGRVDEGIIKGGNILPENKAYGDKQQVNY